MSDPRAEIYRSRARLLRTMADRLETSPLHTLHQWAGTDTWQSPRADQCRDQLSTDRRSLCSAADDLRVTAASFDRQAQELDEAAALAALAAVAVVPRS
ncbi:MAG: hypothetical protein ABW122_00815 [Ilumatobacteraceae bacterium]